MPTRDELLERARALVPTLRERAPACEELRRLPDETAEDLRASGLVNVCKTKAYGGYELGIDVFCEIVMELAKGCASTAWGTMSVATSAHAWATM